MKINSHNEWDKLREVILGSADKQSAVLTWDRKDAIPLKNLEKALLEINIKKKDQIFFTLTVMSILQN